MAEGGKRRSGQRRGDRKNYADACISPIQKETLAPFNIQSLTYIQTETTANYIVVLTGNSLIIGLQTSTPIPGRNYTRPSLPANQWRDSYFATPLEHHSALLSCY